MPILTVPPSPDEVAQAADEISGGALARVRVEHWPRGRSHHAYVLTAPSGAQFLFKVHRRPHAGRMRRFLPLGEPLPAEGGPPPAGPWHGAPRPPPPGPCSTPRFISAGGAPRRPGPT